MGLSEFFQQIADVPSEKFSAEAIAARRRERKLALTKARDELGAYDDYVTALHSIARCAGPGGFSQCDDRWFFAENYETLPVHDNATATIVSLRGVIVPDALTCASPLAIASAVADRYAEGVRVGEFTNVVRLECLCGKLAPLVCRHCTDFDSHYQAIRLRLLCASCERVITLAEHVILDDEDSALLPPAPAWSAVRRK